MAITEKRINRINEVAGRRQKDLTIVLENVHDTHNIGAIMRTCDSVGIPEIYILHNNPELVRKFQSMIIGKNSSSGARKWIDVHFFQDTAKCFQAVRSRYKKIFGTYLNKQSTSLYQLDLTESVALVFGNEHQGITEESLGHLDGNFVIPQVGMVQSLNISVACAVSLYEAFRQRSENGQYENVADPRYSEEIRKEYVKRHEEKFRGRAHGVSKGS